MKRTTASVLAAAAALLAIAPAAAAQSSAGDKAPSAQAAQAKADSAPGATQAPAAQAPAERPWARGVSPEDQKKALALFKEGNALLKESVFVQAAARYREALGHWDHPAIHYNLVLALLNLDQPLEVHHHLQKAMEYGPEPLDLEKFEQAKAYKLLVEKQLARVKIRCSVEGAQITMDGRPLFVAPGEYEGFVRPGPHSIVATKEGYLTNETSRALPAGETTTLDIELLTAADLTEYRRRWDAWKPWSVVAAGVVVAAVGGGLHYTGIDKIRQFDQGIQACGGCVPSADLESTRTTGTRMQGIGIGGYAVGGAALATGAVLVYMNRLQPYQVAPGAEAKPAEPAVSIAPLLGGETNGMSATFRF
ncbi:MAG: PEGA domain-containing protein [Myxococcales bacterium]|jgi:tetratricopeptide (TPR) repeat protein